MSNLGKSLKRERLKREITLTQISEKTNISINVLTALENNRFDEIPGRFYLKNYLNSYLDAVNIDKKKFFEENREIINSVKIKNDSEPKIYFNKLKYSRFKKKNFLAPIVLIFVLFVGSFYFFYTYRQDITNIFKSISGKREIPETGINFNSMFNRFSFDYSPISLEIIFEGDCWTQIIRGNKIEIKQIYKKGDRIKIMGYKLSVILGNPSKVKFYLNNKELTYLKDLKKIETISINHFNIDSFFKK